MVIAFSLDSPALREADAPDPDPASAIPCGTEGQSKGAVLLVGGHGLIGSRLSTLLLARGHSVICAIRRATPSNHPRLREIVVDASQMTAAQWQPHLQGVKVVVNLIGVFRESAQASFEALHVRAATALFDACAMARVERVVQLSALGADDEASTEFLRSKRFADETLLLLAEDKGFEAAVVQPSLVFAPHGASAAMFLRLACLPVLPVPQGPPAQRAIMVQPIHLDDAAEALSALVEAPAGVKGGRRIPLVGPEALSLADYLQALRSALGLRRAPQLPVPSSLMAWLARWGDRLPRHTLLDSAAWRMLQRGNVADAAQTSALLGRAPRQAFAFVQPAEAEVLRQHGQLAWLLPVLRVSLALLWLATAIVSAGIYPIEASFALLAGAGVPAALWPWALAIAVAADLAMGVLSLCAFRGRHWLWLAQAALIATYTVIISVTMPAFWLHPFGPLTKNLPLLAMLAMLWVMEPRGRRTH